MNRDILFFFGTHTDALPMYEKLVDELAKGKAMEKILRK